VATILFLQFLSPGGSFPFCVVDILTSLKLLHFYYLTQDPFKNKRYLGRIVSKLQCDNLINYRLDSGPVHDEDPNHETAYTCNTLLSLQSDLPRPASWNPPLSFPPNTTYTNHVYIFCSGQHRSVSSPHRVGVCRASI
jgi:hypothetical protein